MDTWYGQIYIAIREFVRGIEESPFVRFVAIIALLIVPYQFWQGVVVNRATLAEIEETRRFREETESVVAIKTLEEITEAAREREAEALVRSWAILTTPATGQSGKVSALEYLVSRNQNLNGIDLSCRAMGGLDYDELGNATCVRSPILAWVDLSENTFGWPAQLSGADLSGADIHRADLSGAKILRANLSGADLTSADLSEASLFESDLIRANLSSANFSGASLYGANLNGAKLTWARLLETSLGDASLLAADLSSANLRGANLSRANFTQAILFKADFRNAGLSSAEFSGALQIETARFEGVWAWADREPVGLPFEITLCQYDDSRHDFFQQPSPEDCEAPNE